MLDSGGGGGNKNSAEKQLAHDYAGGFRTSGGSSGTGLGGKVYMGYQQQLGERNLPRVDVMLSKSQAYNFINNLGGKQLADMQTKMIYGGLIQDNDGLIEMQAKWKKLVDASYGPTHAGQNATPMDVLDSYLGKAPLGTKGAATTGQPLSQTQLPGRRQFLVHTPTTPL